MLLQLQTARPGVQEETEVVNNIEGECHIGRGAMLLCDRQLPNRFLAK